MTQTATINCKFVDPPKNGNPKAPWSIKDERGHYWKFWPSKVGTPVQGSQIVVEFELGDEYNGKRDQLIRKIVGESGSTGPTSPPVTNGAPAPAPRPAQDDRTPERIFVCGIINASIQSGALQPFNAGDIAAVGQAAQEAYAQLFGK